MRWIRAVTLAFSTYTRVPMPQVRWDDRAMGLAIAFLPLVGAVLGGTAWAWQWLCAALGLSPVLFAAVTVALPVLITGGIHLDGFCDTSDALASWQSRERRLEIMKDPHVGAFALIRLSVYLLCSFAVLHELYLRSTDGRVLGLVYVLSRAFAAWSAMALPNARKAGMLAAFTEGTDRRGARLTLGLLTAAGLAGWVILAGASGLIALGLGAGAALWYVRMTRKTFGGVTGDTTGFFLQITELALFSGLLTGGIGLEWIRSFC